MPVSNSGVDLSPDYGARPTDAPLIGVCAALAAFLSLTLMSLFAKLLSETHHIVEITFWRYFIALLTFMIAIKLLRRRHIFKIASKPRVVVLRSVVGTLSIMLMFGTYALLPMADATAIIFTSSLFTPMLGFFVLGERVGPYRWSAVLVGFIGVIVVAQPGGEEHWNSLGLTMGLTAALVNSALATMLRHLGQSESPETLTVYFLMIGSTMLAPTMPFFATVPTLEECALLLGLGLCGIAMPMLIATAFKYAPAALISPFNYTQMIWATLFGWLVFADLPATNILIGSAIIIVSSLIVVFREHHIARKARRNGARKTGS